MAARKVSTAMFRMPFRREEEESGLADWWWERRRRPPPGDSHESHPHLSPLL